MATEQLNIYFPKGGLDMAGGSDKLKIVYNVDNKKTTREEYLSKYIRPHLGHDAALHCMQLIHYQIVSIYYDYDDPASQALIHHDLAKNHDFILVEDYNLAVYFSLDHNICMLLCAVFGSQASSPH